MKKLLIGLIAFLFSLLVVANPISIGFSRSKPSAKDIVLVAISDAKESIYVAAYQFTDIDIINAFISAKERGIKVNILVDRSVQNLKSNSLVTKAGIPCFVDTKFRIMHDKVMIIDSTHVQTGSFNYTRSADKANAENVLYIRNIPEVAKVYQDQWDLLLKTTKPCI